MHGSLTPAEKVEFHSKFSADAMRCTYRVRHLKLTPVNRRKITLQWKARFSFTSRTTFSEPIPAQFQNFLRIHDQTIFSCKLFVNPNEFSPSGKKKDERFV